MCSTMKSDNSPASFTPLIDYKPPTDHPMQVILQPLLPTDGSSVVIDTNSGAILSSLISAYCTQKGIKYSDKFVIYDDKRRPLALFSTLSTIGIENGQTLLIGKEVFTVYTEWPIIIAFAASFIGLVGIITISMVYGLKGGQYFDDYGVVMDAGSSKTNTIVYKWRSDKFKGTGCVNQEDNCFAPGGIAKMDPMHLEPVINCAENVTSVIAPESLSKTPLFFAATAGMRLLEVTDPQRAEKVLEQLRKYLPETNLDVKAIEIISGEDEGIYGWITTNFLLDTLALPQTSVPTTYGALDMGGASLQIAYALLPNFEGNTSLYTKDVHLYGQTYKVFAQSNLCFGRDEANNRYDVLLIVNKTDENIIEDPCAPKGYKRNVTEDELYASICANFTKAKKQGKTYTFIGTSNTDACSKKVSQLLDNKLCDELGFNECFKKHTDLLEGQKYLAFATYFYTTHALNVTNATMDEYENAMKSFCNKNLSEIQKITDIEKKYGHQYCFNAHYIYEVLINGFGFSNTTWKNLEFVKEIANKDVGWTLGYMINATNIIPEKTTPRLISKVALALSLTLFIIILLATVVFFLFMYKKNQENSKC